MFTEGDELQIDSEQFKYLTVMKLTRAARALLLILGFLFLGFGLAGIFLPLLPTTPFLLLAALCFERSSDRFHRWLLDHSLLGPFIRDWRERQVIRLKTKWLATGLMAISSYFVLSKDSIPHIGKAAYSIVLLSVLLFIWTRRSK